VVLHGYVENSAGLHELLRDYPVVTGRRRIAARVIVNENYRGRILGDRLAKHFPRVYQRRIEEAACYGNVALEPMLRVEDGDVEFLDGEVLQALAENLMNVSRTPDGHAFVAFLRRHPSSELERGVHGDSARCANAGETRERRHRLRGESS
jgi:hypothetical protein